MSSIQQPDNDRTPQRILLVDDDDLELQLMADRLAALGFETHTAADGLAALERLRERSFPVVITDRQMPRLDGIHLTEELRAQGDTDTYVIMLTVLDDSLSHERGYFAGVDDYLSKRAPDVKIVAAVRAAFKAVELRRALKAAQSRQGEGEASDPSTRTLADRLRAEVKRAARYRRHFSLLVLQLDAEDDADIADATSRAAQIVDQEVRADIDFVARYCGVHGEQRIAVLLPETPRAAAVLVGGRLSVALSGVLQKPLHSITARVGCAAFTPGEESQPSAQLLENIEGLLREAEAGARVVPWSTAQPRQSEAG